MRQEETDSLVTKNIGYAIAIAKQYVGKGVDMEDLVSEGLMAMVECAPKFDASRSIPFVSFAQPYIRHAMERAIAHEAGPAITKPSDNQRAPEEQSPIETAEDKTILEARLQRLNERERKVITLLYGLHNEDRHSMAEAAEKLGLKRERVRQERNKALRKLRKN